MLEIYFETPYTLKRLRSGPSGIYIDGFAQSLAEDGYSWWTARKNLRCAAHLGRFAETVGTALSSVTRQTLKAFWEHLPSCRCPDSNGGATGETLRGAQCFVRYLQNSGMLKPEDSEQWHPLVASFRHWLQHHRGVADSTLNHYSRGATELIRCLGADISRYDAQCLRGFLVDRVRSCGPGTANTLVSALRSFLRYLAVQGKCQAGLDRAIPAVPGWKLAALPRSLSASEVECIVDACDTDSPMGLRDRAIILLLARLGLRADDVAGLRFCDIDWHDGSFLVSGKTRREARLPLPQEVGDALLKYLEHRPQAKGDTVFIRAVPPFRPLRSGHSVSGIVRRAMLRANVVAPSYGAHILRHTAATEMLHQGVSLYEIGAVLRHRSVDMTAYYAKVDRDLLRQVVQPWPEVLSC